MSISLKPSNNSASLMSSKLELLNSSVSFSTFLANGVSAALGIVVDASCLDSTLVRNCCSLLFANPDNDDELLLDDEVLIVFEEISVLCGAVICENDVIIASCCFGAVLVVPAEEVRAGIVGTDTEEVIGLTEAPKVFLFFRCFEVAADDVEVEAAVTSCCCLFTLSYFMI